MAVEDDDLEGRIAIIGMAGRLPGAPDVDHVLGEPARAASSRSSSSPRTSCSPPARASTTSAIPSYVRAAAPLDDIDQFDAALLRDEPARRRRLRSRSTACSWSARGRRSRTPATSASASTAPSACSRRAASASTCSRTCCANEHVADVGRRVARAPHRQRHQLPRHPGLLRARPPRPEHERADGVQLDARRRPPRLPEPAQRRVRRRPRRRRGRRAGAATAATSTRRARSSRPTGTAGRSTPSRPARSSPAPCGCVVLKPLAPRRRRRRQRPRGRPRLGDQQRRPGQGRLPRPERRRARPRSSPRRWPSPASTPATSPTSRPTAPAR